MVGGGGGGGCGAMTMRMIFSTLAAVVEDVGEINGHASTELHPDIDVHHYHEEKLCWYTEAMN